MLLIRKPRFLLQYRCHRYAFAICKRQDAQYIFSKTLRWKKDQSTISSLLYFTYWLLNHLAERLIFLHFCAKIQMTLVVCSDTEVEPLYFNPFVIQSCDGTKVPAKIIPASDADITSTHGSPAWQTDWDSAYLQDASIQKYALKTSKDELVALGAYQISGRHAYVYIVYLETAPHSNPTITTQSDRKYYGVGAAMIAFGIKYSIDHGCRGDVVFEAKTDALAKHYQEDFHALPLPGASTSGPRRFMLADEEAWNLFSKYLSEEEPI